MHPFLLNLHFIGCLDNGGARNLGVQLHCNLYNIESKSNLTTYLVFCTAVGGLDGSSSGEPYSEADSKLGKGFKFLTACMHAFIIVFIQT